MPNYLYQIPPEKIGAAGRGLKDKLLQFYLENQNDIDAILSYPGNPISYSVKTMPSLALVVRPSNVEKLIEKMVKAAGVGSKSLYKPAQMRGFDKLDAAVKFLQAKNPRLSSLVTEIKIQPTDLELSGAKVLSSFDPATREIYIDPELLNENLATSDFVDILAKELYKAYKYHKNSPLTRYISPATTATKSSAFIAHPLEAAAYKAGKRAKQSFTLFDIWSGVPARYRNKSIGKSNKWGNLVEGSPVDSSLKLFNRLMQILERNYPGVEPVSSISPDSWNDLVAMDLFGIYNDTELDLALQKLAAAMVGAKEVKNPRLLK